MGRGRAVIHLATVSKSCVNHAVAWDVTKWHCFILLCWFLLTPILKAHYILVAKMMRIIYVSISTQERCKKIMSVLSWSLLLCWKSPDGGIKVLWSSCWLPFLGKDHRFWLHYRDCHHTWCKRIKIHSGCEVASAFVFLLAAVACYWLHGQHVTWALVGMTCKLATYRAGVGQALCTCGKINVP